VCIFATRTTRTVLASRRRAQDFKLRRARKEWYVIRLLNFVWRFSFFSLALLCLPPLSWSENENLTGLRELIDSILELGKLKKLAEGDQLFKETIWQPCFPDTKPSIAEHIRRLEIPAFEGSTVPCLLVHDLGSFSRRPELIARLDRIFHSKHTYGHLSP